MPGNLAEKSGKLANLSAALKDAEEPRLMALEGRNRDEANEHSKLELGLDMYGKIWYHIDNVRTNQSRIQRRRKVMGKESRIEIRIEEEVKKRARVVASSLGFTLSEYVCSLIDKDIKQREEEINLEARRYLDDMQKWSTRYGKPVSELLSRIENLARPSPTPRTAREIALELEKDGMRQTDIADILNQQGHTYGDGLPFTQPRVWHLLNPNGRSERVSRLGLCQPHADQVGPAPR